MRRRAALLQAVLAMGLLAGLAVDAHCAEQTEISADTLLRKGPVLELEGSVVLKRGEAALKADRAVYNTETGQISATGGVSYEDSGVAMRAERAEVNIKTGLGVLYDASAFFRENNLRFKGDEIHRYGPDRYMVRQGSATTCDGIPPAWCLTGRDIDVLAGKRIKAWHVTMRIRDLPVFYTPYLWAPIITERQTGLLSPTFGYRDSTGFFWRQPFFWAISENRDATVTLDYYSRRALGQGLEYRYVEGPGIEGSLNLYHLRDSIRDTDFYEFTGRHMQMGGLLSGFIEVNLLSEREFYTLYGPTVELSSTRFLETRAEVYSPLGNSRLYLLARHFQDLTEEDNGSVLQREPELGFFLAPVGIGPALFTASASAVRFERETGARGNRFGLELKGAYSIGRGPVFTQTAGVRQTLYELEYDPPEGEARLSNRAYSYDATLFAAFGRRYGETSHQLETSASYRYVGIGGETPSPEEPFDSTELLEEASEASLSLINRLIGRKGEFFTLRLSQPYGLKSGGEGFLPMELDISLKGPLLLTARAEYDHEEGRAERADSRAALRFQRTEISAGHTYSRGELETSTIDSYNLALRQGVTGRLELRAAARYDRVDEKGLEELSATVTYQGQCWGLEISLLKRPEDYTAYVNLNLMGLGRIGTN